jgi:hypothetical protein
MGRMLALLTVAATLAGCGGAAASSAHQGGLTVIVAAGPTCPVEQVGNPCNPRRVPRATLVVERPSGERVASLVASDGRGSLDGLDAGRYRLIPQPVSGPMGTPAPVSFSVTTGVVTRLRITYDTGIR